MSAISMSSARRAKMDRPLPSTKSIAFPVGTVIEIIGIREASYKVDGIDQPNDKLVVRVAGGDKTGTFLMPVRELLKGAVSEGSEALFSEEDGNTFFPAKLTIAKAEDRKDRDGNLVYPVQAYNAFEAQLEAGNGIDWNALVESKVKDDNALSPVQNYTFTIGE